MTELETLEVPTLTQKLSFLKISTDVGLTGWAEYPEGSIGSVVTPTLHVLGKRVVGADPRDVRRIVGGLRSATRSAASGAVARAIGAIENALVDLVARSLEVPVAMLLGGAIRDELPTYWSHCGSHHIDHWRELGVAPIRSLDDVKELGRQVRGAGYRSLKTNLMVFDDDGAYLYRPGFGGAGDPDRNPVEHAIRGAVRQLAAFREGAGDEMRLKLDINHNFRAEGALRLARELEPLGLDWLELDGFDAAELASVRRGTSTPIASCEILTGLGELRPYVEARAVDVVIIDVAWNGVLEAMRMAALADAFGINVACHNFSGPLATLMSAQFCAAVPNFREFELDVVQEPWMEELIATPTVRTGDLLTLPSGIGWGSDVVEDAIRARG